MKQVFLILFFCGGCLASAEVFNSCGEIRALQLRLAMTASNLANIHTTRTPEGGPYRPFVITGCDRLGCRIAKSKARVYKFLPDHPDADRHGYVAFPIIDQKAEAKVFHMTVERLKFLAHRHACGAEIVADRGPASLTIGYARGPVQEDVVHFTDSRLPISWERSYFAGNTDTMNFRLSPAGGPIY